MENQDDDPRRIIFIRIDNTPEKPDPEMMAWLESFVSRIYQDSFTMAFSEQEGTGDPTLMQEIEYIDTIVTGDHIPEAYDMIMNAFYKHENGHH